MSINYQKKVEGMLQSAGVTLGGETSGDITVHDNRFYKRVIFGGSLALGESYMDGWWDSEHLDEFFNKVLRAGLAKKLAFWRQYAREAFSAIYNYQSKSRAFEVGEKHYDAGNDLYRAMLDKRLTYTCGYWKNAHTLDEAQEAKLDLVCRKLNLKPREKILDIGCGWGSFAKFATEKYGVSVVGVTVSKEQVALGKELCQGLPVEFQLKDYRDIEGKYDHIVSLGMFEHVGYKNYKTYMEGVKEHLKDDGLFLLHTIGRNTSVKSADAWMHKYIFPNGTLPSVAQIGEALEGNFVMEDWHSFGSDYDKTLMEWHKNVEAKWGTLKDKYSERFRRMWKYYLLSFAGSFRARNIQLWQIVLSKKGRVDGYNSIR